MCLPKMVLKHFKPYHCYRLCPTCSVWKTKVENQQALFLPLQASSDHFIIAGRYIYTLFAFTKRTLSFQCTDPFYIGCQFQNVVVTLT